MKSKFRVLVILAFLLMLSAVSVANAAGRPAAVASSNNLAPITIPAGAKIIPNQYIVVFKAGAQANTLTSLTSMVEASGGITVDSMKDYLCDSVDIISQGKLTQGYDCVDFSLKIV